MKSFMASNSTYFDTPSNLTVKPVKKTPDFNLRPYAPMPERFKQVLRRGDSMLIHLMLKQASHAKSKRLLRTLLKELVSQASKPN